MLIFTHQLCIIYSLCCKRVLSITNILRSSAVSEKSSCANRYGTSFLWIRNRVFRILNFSVFFSDCFSLHIPLLTERLLLLMLDAMICSEWQSIPLNFSFAIKLRWGRLDNRSISKSTNQWKVWKLLQLFWSPTGLFWFLHIKEKTEATSRLLLQLRLCGLWWNKNLHEPKSLKARVLH